MLFPAYRYVDGVWTFLLKDAEVAVNGRDLLRIPYLKVVACDGTRTANAK